MLRPVFVLALTLTQALPTVADTRLDALVVPPGNSVAGQPLASYANQWWQWAFSMPDRESPIVDEVGTYCGVGQSGPVWFLAGGYGSAKIQRACEIPADRHLFFPLINVVEVLYPTTEADCPVLQAKAARNNETFVYLKLSLDGEALGQAEQFRIASDTCFDPFFRAPAEAQAPSNALAATDGYWIMLRPLPVGPHRLEFQAFYTNPDETLGEMVQNIAYDLMVVSE